MAKQKKGFKCWRMVIPVNAATQNSRPWDFAAQGSYQRVDLVTYKSACANVVVGSLGLLKPMFEMGCAALLSVFGIKVGMRADAGGQGKVPACKQPARAPW